MRAFIMVVIFGTAAGFCVSTATHNHYPGTAAIVVTALLVKIADLLMEIRDKL